MEQVGYITRRINEIIGELSNIHECLVNEDVGEKVLEMLENSITGLEQFFNNSIVLHARKKLFELGTRNFTIDDEVRGLVQRSFVSVKDIKKILDELL
jgi:hypothetical protein